MCLFCNGVFADVEGESSSGSDHSCLFLSFWWVLCLAGTWFFLLQDVAHVEGGHGVQESFARKRFGIE